MSELNTQTSHSKETKELVTLVIVDDEREICDGLKTLFEASGDIVVLGIGHSGKDAIRLVTERRPQVLLLDLHFPEGISGIDVIKQLSAEPEITTRILVYTFDRTEDMVFEAIKAGADSYAWKEESYSELKEAVLATSRREAYITPTMAKMVLDFFKTTGKLLNKIETG